MVSFKEGEFVIQSKVNNQFRDKHFFIEEELEAEEEESKVQSDSIAQRQVIDDGQNNFGDDEPYRVCEIQVLEDQEEAKGKDYSPGQESSPDKRCGVN